jgi:hypothetical protein
VLAPNNADCTFNNLLISKTFSVHSSYWKQLENKQEMKHSRFMKWNNCINKQEITKVASNATITKLWLATTNKA